MAPKACNNFVLIIRNETAEEVSGMWLPEQGRVKPNIGTIFSVGKLVKDPDIKGGKGKKCLYHSTVGFGITHEGQEYWVLMGDEIISIV